MHKFQKYLLIVELLLLPLIAILSWVFSLYMPMIRSLLHPNGIRWITTHIISNFTILPIGEIILFLIALSLLSALNPRTLFDRKATQKEKRAHLFALLMLLMNVLVVVSFTFFPPYILLNFLGTLSDSPFSDSIPAFIFIAIETTCCTYAYTSGKMTTIQDFAQVHSSMLVKFAPFFIHLFLLSQIIGWVKFTNIISYL